MMLVGVTIGDMGCFEVLKDLFKRVLLFHTRFITQA